MGIDAGDGPGTYSSDSFWPHSAGCTRRQVRELALTHSKMMDDQFLLHAGVRHWLRGWILPTKSPVRRKPHLDLSLSPWLIDARTETRKSFTDLYDYLRDNIVS